MEGGGGGGFHTELVSLILFLVFCVTSFNLGSFQILYGEEPAVRGEI